MSMAAARITAAERRELDEIAGRIHEHLVRIEADPDLNGRTSLEGRTTQRCFNAQAWRHGRSVKVRYVAYQGESAMDKAHAERYLAALDAGYLGRHHEHSLAAFEAK
jgi:hypothetical protein